MWEKASKQQEELRWEQGSAQQAPELCNKKWIHGEIVCLVVRFCGLGSLADVR